jgi:hypothetical protein
MLHPSHQRTKFTRVAVGLLVLVLALMVSGVGTAVGGQSSSSGLQWRNEGFRPDIGWTTGEIGPYPEGSLVPFRLTVTNSGTKATTVGGFSLQVTSQAHGVSVFDSTTDWTGPIAPSSQDGAADNWLRTTFPAGMTLAPGASATFTFKGHLAVSTPGHPAAGMINGNGVCGYSEVDAPGVGNAGKRVPVKVSPGSGTLGTPAVDILKTSDAPVAGVAPGTSVTYSYKVVNIGDVPLYGAVVTDDKLGDVGTIPGPIAPGGFATLSATAVLAETTTNIATVTAGDGHGRDVSDSAQLTVGVFASARIFGSSFDDANFNGAWDAGEIGASGWTVLLMDDQGALVASTISGVDGAYAFDGVTPGKSYVVAQIAQGGWVQSAPVGGTFTVVPVNGQDAGPYDFGNYSTEPQE